MAKVTGIVIVKIDGGVVRSKEGAKLNIGGKERTPIVGHKLYGPAEKFIHATMEFTLAHVGGDDLIGLSAKVDATLEFETDTGDTYMMANSFATKPAELSGGEGDVSLEFAGDPAKLIG